jgi:hypothetical protein
VKVIERLSRQALAQLGAWGLLGWCVAAAGWAQGFEPMLLCLVLPLWALAPRASHAFVFILAYMMSSSDSIGLGAPAFANTAVGVVVLEVGWVLMCSAIAGVWALAHVPFRRSAVWGAAAGIALQLLLLMPPLWLLGSVSPLIGWGFVLGGTGSWGLVIAIVVSTAAGALLRTRRTRDQCVTVVTVAALVLLLARTEEPQLRSHSNIYGAELRWNGPGREGWGEAVDRIGKVGRAAAAAKKADPDLMTIVFPEGVLGDMIGRMDLAFDLEIVRVAKANKIQILVGADENQDGVRRVGLLVVSPDGQVTAKFARQPMPVSLWHPWSPDSYLADWDADPLVTLPDGRRAYISVCYEDLVPGLFMAGMRKSGPRPDVVISVANVWWMPSDKGGRRQAKVVQGMARLYGIPLVRSVNFPVAPN